VLLSSGDNFPHLIQKRRSQLGFVTYLLNYPRTTVCYALMEVPYFVIRIECVHFIYASKVLLSVGCILQHIQRLLVVY